MSGRADPGEMLAIMGTSGAGKTTLLDILAGRLISKNLTGHILTNDRPVNYSTFRKQSGYVMQSDALFPLLTVKETLHYAAHLGIQGKTYAEREAAANSTMMLLRLEHVQDTIIGDDLTRGLSGGEKRRVSIAVDIIHEPPVIFLDEPTSGQWAKYVNIHFVIESRESKSKVTIYLSIYLSIDLSIYLSIDLSKEASHSYIYVDGNFTCSPILQASTLRLLLLWSRH